MNTWKRRLRVNPSSLNDFLPVLFHCSFLMLITWPLTFVIRQVGFEDIIAEPVSTHSFDRVWIGSHATFELVKFVFYRLLSTLLAVPVAFILGLLFGLLSCVHIW